MYIDILVDVSKFNDRIHTYFLTYETKVALSFPEVDTLTPASSTKEHMLHFVGITKILIGKHLDVVEDFS